MRDAAVRLMEAAAESLRGAKGNLEIGFPGFAATRAYYAMFNAAQALLAKKDLRFTKHSAVIAAFGREFAKTGLLPAELHRAMLTAQRHRLSVDYGGPREVSAEDAIADIRNAETFLTLAQGYLEGAG